MISLVSIAVTQEPASAAEPGANEVIALDSFVDELADSQRRFGWGPGEAFAYEEVGGALDFEDAFAYDAAGGALIEDFEEAFAGEEEDNFGSAALDARSFGMHPMFDGKWIDGEGLCVAEFPTYWPANLAANHGALCRNNQIHQHGTGWACPKSCTFHSRTQRPYCVWPRTTSPCTYHHPKFNGKWFPGEALCPAGYHSYWPGQRGVVNKGAVCKNQGPFVHGVGWECPTGCTFRHKSIRPFCVYDGTTEPCTYLDPMHNGKWMFVGLSGEGLCPAGFPTYWPANLRANHGAVCRNKEIHNHPQGWICPKTCALHSMTTRPYCVNRGTTDPCTKNGAAGRRLEVLDAASELELKAPETTRVDA